MIRGLWLALLVGAAALAQTPVLRPGIRVDMAVTSSATPMREADQAGALIVAVTRDGTVYLDATVATPTALADALRAGRSAGVFVKADAGASYQGVSIVLGALRAAGAGAVNLLTSQREAADGRDAPPKGISVSFGGLPGTGEKSVVLDAAGTLLFGDVVRIIDASRSVGAKVFLR